MKLVATALALCALAGCVANPFSQFDDPRPEGRLSLQERSHCEDPNDPEARWCGYPHEVRSFTQKRQECDHFRGEPVPEPENDPGGERKKDIRAALAKRCTGTDAELARLRAKYRDDADISKALAVFEDRTE
jgi:hypothetical protein